MRCRRCNSIRLIQLDKKIPDDHEVFRCQDCGFLFSPGGPSGSTAGNSGPAAPTSRTVAIQSGYRPSE